MRLLRARRHQWVRLLHLCTDEPRRHLVCGIDVIQKTGAYSIPPLGEIIDCGICRAGARALPLLISVSRSPIDSRFQRPASTPTNVKEPVVLLLSSSSGHGLQLNLLRSTLEEMQRPKNETFLALKIIQLQIALQGGNNQVVNIPDQCRNLSISSVVSAPVRSHRRAAAVATGLYSTPLSRSDLDI